MVDREPADAAHHLRQAAAGTRAHGEGCREAEAPRGPQVGARGGWRGRGRRGPGGPARPQRSLLPGQVLRASTGRVGLSTTLFVAEVASIGPVPGNEGTRSWLQVR